MTVDGVMVARAALAEVGLADVHAVRSTTGRGVNVGGPDRSPVVAGMRLTFRAMALGHIAEHGPESLIRCHDCAPHGRRRGTVACTPARDALRGVTCGREP